MGGEEVYMYAVTGLGSYILGELSLDCPGRRKL